MSNDLAAILRGSSSSTRARNRHLFPDVEGVRPAQREPAVGQALVRAGRGKAPRRAGFEIVFTVFAIRPNDWDNVWTKPLQDHLVRAGILDDDRWDFLAGRVLCCKAKTKAEERTEITITRI